MRFSVTNNPTSAFMLVKSGRPTALVRFWGQKFRSGCEVIGCLSGRSPRLCSCCFTQMLCFIRLWSNSSAIAFFCWLLKILLQSPDALFLSYLKILPRPEFPTWVGCYRGWKLWRKGQCHLWEVCPRPPVRPWGGWGGVVVSVIMMVITHGTSAHARHSV